MKGLCRACSWSPGRRGREEAQGTAGPHVSPLQEDSVAPGRSLPCSGNPVPLPCLAVEEGTHTQTGWSPGPFSPQCPLSSPVPTPLLPHSSGSSVLPHSQGSSVTKPQTALACLLKPTGPLPSGASFWQNGPEEGGGGAGAGSAETGPRAGNVGRGKSLPGVTLVELETGVKRRASMCTWAWAWAWARVCTLVCQACLVSWGEGSGEHISIQSLLSQDGCIPETARRIYIRLTMGPLPQSL